MNGPRALTSSSWINAWTLHRACAALGVALYTTEAQRELPLPRADRAAAGDWLFFTDEKSLALALAGEAPGRFLPQQFPSGLLDDKWAFATWLAQDPLGPPGLPQWPLAEAAAARYPLLLKCRHSWRGPTKLPRGWVCRDAGELERALGRLRAQGWREDWFFLQQWYGEQPMQLLSVGGFFDADDERRNLACVTERLADYGGGPSSSAVLATVADELGLVGRAESVLRRLRYRGPYEVEFVVAAGEPPRLLELNPRFWMQHGLFLAAGNGLVKRYFGVETALDRQAPAPDRLLWVDGVWLLRRLSRADRRVVGLLWRWIVGRGYRAVVCPSLPAVLRAGLWRACGGARA